MKTLKLVACLAVALSLAGYGRAMADGNSANADANATATVVVPISITKDADLNFGDIFSSVDPQTIIVPATPVQFARRGAGLAGAPTTSAAAFTVSGEPNATYAITLPGSCELSDGAQHTMTADTFTSDPSGTGQLDGGGTQALHVGATLHVAGNQASGNYNGSFNVMVAYN